ncbi:MAG TPA: hypothetical protein VGR69_07530 [Candidatus Rubrimentiphilum sp.]|nr:hypothetical protein [Candidatus Rubrimentiphilum sp.]
MPVETRLFVKTSLLWLCATFALGAAMLIAKALGAPLGAEFSVVHAHMAFVGWLVNLVMGIALWFLPVNRERFPQNRGRYPVDAVRWIFLFLNVGLLLRITFEPLADTEHAAILSGILIISAALQLAAVLLFVTIAWSRVRQV